VGSGMCIRERPKPVKRATGDDFSDYEPWLAEMQKRAIDFNFTMSGYLSQVIHGAKQKLEHTTFEPLNEVEYIARIQKDGNETIVVFRAWLLTSKRSESNDHRTILVMEIDGKQATIPRVAVVPLLWEIENNHHKRFANLCLFTDDVIGHYAKNFSFRSRRWNSRNWAQDVAPRRMPA